MHLPVDMSLWQGRVDHEEGADALRLHQWVRPLEAYRSGPGAALLGFACDEGVRRNQGRVGAAQGPAAIRRDLAGTACHMSPLLYDAGDLVSGEGVLEAAQEDLAQVVADLLGKGLTPIVLGGGHETAYGSDRGLRRYLAQVSPGSSVGVVNFDAHFDLRCPVEGASSGTPFAQVAEDCQRAGTPFHYACFGISRMVNTRALFDRASRLGVRYFLDTELQAGREEFLGQALREFVASCDFLHLSIDLDVLPAGTAPGVSAPAGLGIPFGMLLSAVEVLRQAVDGAGRPKLLLADICELNPQHDIDGRTAKVAARLCHDLFD